MGNKASKSKVKDTSSATTKVKTQPNILEYERSFKPNQVRSKYLNNNLLWGYGEHSTKPKNEDEASYIYYNHPIDGDIHIYGIYDGHGGYSTSLYTSKNFLQYLSKQHLQSKNSILENNFYNQLFKNIFESFDKIIEKENLKGGCTVICVMILKKYNKIISSNVGDARVLLSHNGNSNNVIQLSIDHNIEYDFNNILNNYNKNKKLFESNKDFSNVFRVNKVNPYELEKKEDILDLDEEEKQKTPIITVSTKKILNTIAVSRVFGDYNLNVRYMKDMNVRPLLSSIPYVKLIDLNDYQIKFNDLLLLSCDGPYDVMKNNQVIENIQKYIYEDKNINNFESLTIDILDESCVKLGKLSHEMGTIDDISVFVIPLYQFVNQNNKQMEPSIDSNK